MYVAGLGSNSHQTMEIGLSRSVIWRIYAKWEHFQRERLDHPSKRERLNLCFGDEGARAGSNLAELALSTIIISDSRSLEARFCLLFPTKSKALEYLNKTKFPNLAQIERKTHKRNHMITFQLREEPFIHKRPETNDNSPIHHWKVQTFPKKKKISQRANLGFDETCLTLEGLTMALVEDWGKTEKKKKKKKIAKNNKHPLWDIDIVSGLDLECTRVGTRK